MAGVIAVGTTAVGGRKGPLRDELGAALAAGIVVAVRVGLPVLGLHAAVRTLVAVENVVLVKAR